MVFAALSGGLGPGLLATALSALCAEIFFFPPVGSLQLDDPVDRAKIVAFVLVSVLISALSEAMHRSRRQSEQFYRNARLSEERLRESEARFRLAIDGSPIAVFTCDRDLRFTWIYNAQPPIIDPALYIGKRDDEIVPGDSGALSLTAVKQRVLESGVSAA